MPFTFLRETAVRISMLKNKPFKRLKSDIMGQNRTYWDIRAPLLDSPLLPIDILKAEGFNFHKQEEWCNVTL